MYRYIYISQLFTVYSEETFCSVSFLQSFTITITIIFYRERRKLLKSYGWNACFVFCYDL